jgi:hypothetical protein
MRIGDRLVHGLSVDRILLQVAVERLAGRDRPAEAEQRREVEDRHRGAREVEASPSGSGR